MSDKAAGGYESRDRHRGPPKELYGIPIDYYTIRGRIRRHSKISKSAAIPSGGSMNSVITAIPSGRSRSGIMGAIPSGGSRSGVDTSANFFEFWILCFILFFIRVGSSPTLIDVEHVMATVYGMMMASGTNSIIIDGVEVHFPNKEKIDKYWFDWQKKKNNQKIIGFLESWRQIVFDDLDKDPKKISSLYVGCHPPDVIEHLAELGDTRGKNATPDVTVVYNNGELLGYSAKQDQTKSASMVFGNYSLDTILKGLDPSKQLSNRLTDAVDSIVAEYKQNNPNKKARYAREKFEIGDKTRHFEGERVVFGEGTPFSIIQEILDNEDYRPQLISSVNTTLFQQLYPGTVRCIGSRSECIDNINNVVPYDEHAQLWTHPELYSKSNAAKMYYLLFSPFWDVDAKKWKWICYKLEFGRRGDTNYKIIATKLCWGDICDPIFFVAGVHTRGFIMDSIQNFKTQMRIDCTGGGSASIVAPPTGGGGGSASIVSPPTGGGGDGKEPNKRKRGGSRKRKSLRRRKTRRSKKN